MNAASPRKVGNLPPPPAVAVTRLERVDFIPPGVPIGMAMTHHDFIAASPDKPIELRQGLIHYGADVYPLHMVKRLMLKKTDGS